MGRTGGDRAGSGPLTSSGGAQLSGALSRLMLVTDRLETRGRDLVDVVAAAVAGGVGLVQVRERDLPEAEVEALLRRILERLRGTRAQLLVNGHPALALLLDVGLHLPASAPPPTPPRPTLCGRAVHDEAEARQALAEAASYVVVGPVFLHGIEARPSRGGSRRRSGGSPGSSPRSRSTRSAVSRPTASRPS